jgi:major membrane immunogen (membrane-anchored lipoprotein)
MLRTTARALAASLLVTSCGASNHSADTVADHERKARHYEATADSIEDECWKDRRNQLTVDDPEMCWKGEDVRFLEANRNAAVRHRAEAQRLSAGR